MLTCKSLHKMYSIPQVGNRMIIIASNWLRMICFPLWVIVSRSRELFTITPWVMLTLTFEWLILLTWWVMLLIFHGSVLTLPSLPWWVIMFNGLKVSIAWVYSRLHCSGPWNYISLNDAGHCSESCDVCLLPLFANKSGG